MQILRGHEHEFLSLARLDSEQRKLGGTTPEAIAALAYGEANCHWSILCEILARSLFFMEWASINRTIASRTAWEDVVTQATETIGALDVDDAVLQRFRLSREVLESHGWAPSTWVEMALLQILGDPALVANALPSAFGFHRRVTDKAIAHLALTADNVGRSHWLAGAILHPDPAKAQAAASRLARHLATTTPTSRTSFEAHLFGDPVLYAALVDFASARPPV